MIQMTLQKEKKIIREIAEMVAQQRKKCDTVTDGYFREFLLFLLVS